MAKKTYAERLKPSGNSYGSAFSAAKKAGKKEFTWKGRDYTTETAEERKADFKKESRKEQFTRKKAQGKQAGLSDYQAAQTAAYEPYQRLGTYGAGVSSLISGYPAQYQSTQTPNASPLQTALGLGTGLAGLYGGLTGNNPFKAIGSAFGIGK